MMKNFKINSMELNDYFLDIKVYLLHGGIFNC